MNDVLKQPIIWIGIGIFIIALIIVSGRFDEKEGGSTDSKEIVPTESLFTIDKKIDQQVNDEKQQVSDADEIDINQLDPVKSKILRHQDMLSEEMKQAIRDELILHGPQETFEKSDGTTVLPSDGRSTQVSVAVQMPDGTIEIREYSELPEIEGPKYTVSPESKK